MSAYANNHRIQLPCSLGLGHGGTLAVTLESDAPVTGAHLDLVRERAQQLADALSVEADLALDILKHCRSKGYPEPTITFGSHCTGAAPVSQDPALDERDIEMQVRVPSSTAHQPRYSYSLRETGK